MQKTSNIFINGSGSSGSLVARKMRQYIPLQFLLSFSVISLGMVDGIITGRLIGPLALAATETAYPFTIFLSVISTLIVSGLTVSLSLYVGKRGSAMLENLYRNIRFLMLAGGAGILLFQIPLAWLLLHSTQLGDLLFPEARQYYIGLLFGSAFGYFNAVGAGVLNTGDRTDLVLREAAVEMAVNIAADIAFIRVFHLGVLGAGLGSSVAMFVRSLLLFSHLKRKTGLFVRTEARPTPAIKPILRNGFPNGLNRLLMAVRAWFMTWLVSVAFGWEGIAVRAILGFCTMIVIFYVDAVNDSFRPLFRLFDDLSDRRAESHALRQSLILQFAGTLVLSLLLLLFHRGILTLYGMKTLREETLRAIRIYCFYFLGSSVTLAFSNYYSAKRQRRKSFLLFLLRGIALQIPFGLILLVCGGNIWWSSSAASCLSALAGVLLADKALLRGGVENDHRILKYAVKPQDAPELYDQLAAFLKEQDLPARYANRINLLLEELISGIRNKNDRDVNIEGSIHFFDTYCTIAVIDDGVVRNVIEAVQRVNDRKEELFSEEAVIGKLTRKMSYQWAYGLNFTTAQVDLKLEDPKRVKTGKFPYFSQQDSRWRYQKYGSSTIGESGCGPTCMAMCWSGLRNEETDPARMAAFSEANGWYYPGIGTSWGMMNEGAEKLGLSVEMLDPDTERMTQALREGKGVIATVGPGDFTTEGHFIFLCGLAENGEILVHDPNSVLRSRKSWPADRLIGQMKKMWIYDAEKAT